MRGEKDGRKTVGEGSDIVNVENFGDVIFDAEDAEGYEIFSDRNSEVGSF